MNDIPDPEIDLEQLYQLRKLKWKDNTSYSEDINDPQVDDISTINTIHMLFRMNQLIKDDEEPKIELETS
jgi:hypothetical protein